MAYTRAIKAIYSPMRGMAMCIKWACSWSCALPSSACSPSRSFPRTSWGTLHPHPFRSANRVRRKVASRSCATGSNGLRKAKAFGFPPSSNWATDRASWATGVPCSSAILLKLNYRRTGYATCFAALYNDSLPTASLILARYLQVGSHTCQLRSLCSRYVDTNLRTPPTDSHWSS